ncbi:hypothetical protein, partial [Cronobacter sakazakii]|uniref:hypothetical protein n=1 Tax=Cronobacter sakazakii TaxID=28141 RepID=UPI00195F2352
GASFSPLQGGREGGGSDLSHKKPVNEYKQQNNCDECHGRSCRAGKKENNGLATPRAKGGGE